MRAEAGQDHQKLSRLKRLLQCARRCILHRYKRLLRLAERFDKKRRRKNHDGSVRELARLRRHWNEAHGIGRKELKIKFPLLD